MAPFPAPQAIVDGFRSAGLTVVELDGWRDRCRCHAGSHEKRVQPTGRAFRSFHGVTWHHTAGPMLGGQAAIDYCKQILVRGNGVVPGPLCLAGVDKDGRMIMISAGRANHIGSISQRSLTAMRNASFSLEGSQNLRGSGVDGNAYTLGFEILAPGVPNDKQREATKIASAVINDLCGWSGQETHGHGECSDQRGFSDPGFDMGRVRRDVMEAGEKLRRVVPTPAAPLPDVVEPGRAPGYRTDSDWDPYWVVGLPIPSDEAAALIAAWDWELYPEDLLRNVADFAASRDRDGDMTPDLVVELLRETPVTDPGRYCEYRSLFEAAQSFNGVDGAEPGEWRPRDADTSIHSVRALEAGLRKQGFSVADNGVWRPELVEAIRAYQSAHNLEPTGFPTWKQARALVRPTGMWLRWIY